MSLNEREALEKAKLEAEVAKLQFENAKIVVETAKLEDERKKIEQEIIYSSRNNKDKEADAYQHREYTIYEQVNRQSVSRAIESLDHWSRRDPGAKITIRLNSPGGSVFDGLALYDFIKLLQAQGHTIDVKAFGMAASMGGVLLQAGNTRYLGANSYLLIHEVSAASMGNVSEMEESLEFTKRLQNNLVRILAERSRMTETQIKRKWKKTDWWLGAEEALELGFIDEII